MLSLHYYTNVFGNDSVKMAKIKRLIWEDFKKAELIFFEADTARDVVKMKAQLHKIYPIVSNLNYEEFIYLIELYKIHDRYNIKLLALNKELKKCLIQVYRFLEA